MIIALESILGQDIRFWMTVFMASLLKWLFTPEDHQQTRKQAIAGIVAGAVCAFYGSDYILTKFEIASSDRDIVVIGLVFTGEHIVRTFFNFGPLFVRKLFGITNEEAKANKDSSSDN
jgi:hypothetical protein